MSSFYGKTINYNGISSEEYGLRIVDFDTGVTDGNMGSEPTLHQKWVIRKSKVYFYGRSLNTPLQIEITLAAENPIDSNTRSLIGKWLLAQNSYLPLNVEQDDLYDITFYTIFDSVIPKYIGNENRALTIKGVCNAPWGFQFPKTTTKSYSGSYVVSDTFNYLCTSDDSDYLYPSMVFHTSGSTGGSACSFSLTNHTDGSRVSSFTELSGSEIMTVDNDLGIISSSTGLLRMAKFNKKLFRLVPGNNRLTLSGSLVTFSMIVNNPKKVGA